MSCRRRNLGKRSVDGYAEHKKSVIRPTDHMAEAQLRSHGRDLVPERTNSRISICEITSGSGEVLTEQVLQGEVRRCEEKPRSNGDNESEVPGTAISASSSLSAETNEDEFGHTQ